MAIKLKKRSFDVLRVPWQKNWADGFQIVNYEAGQFYNTHTDFFGLGTTRDWNWDPSSGGINRFATVFVYLSDAELGGETMFPLAGKIPEDGATSEIAYKMRDQLVANGNFCGSRHFILIQPNCTSSVFSSAYPIFPLNSLFLLLIRHNCERRSRVQYH